MRIKGKNNIFHLNNKIVGGTEWEIIMQKCQAEEQWASTDVDSYQRAARGET